MSFFAHRMALRVQPRLKSWHVAWDPRAVRGLGRIEQAHFRGLYVTCRAAAFLERRAAVERPGGVAAVEAVEMVDGSQSGVRMENVANGAWGVERGGRGRGGVDEGGAGSARTLYGVTELTPRAGTGTERKGPGAEAALPASETTMPVGIPP